VRELTLREVDEGAERARQRVESWPDWKRNLETAMKHKPDIVPYPSLLPHLHALVGSQELTDLWADEAAWSSLSIDYHPPRVERLYADLPDKIGRPQLRVMLHRLHPCKVNAALWHSHPWPSAVMLLDGTYEHGAGFVNQHGLHSAVKSILHAGDSYEISDPLAWHYARPIDAPVHSLMITGKPWSKHTAPKPDPQRPLTAVEVEDMRRTFGDLLFWTGEREQLKVQRPTNEQDVRYTVERQPDQTFGPDGEES
jgi:hypothetical protein